MNIESNNTTPDAQTGSLAVNDAQRIKDALLAAASSGSLPGSAVGTGSLAEQLAAGLISAFALIDRATASPALTGAL